MSNLDDEDKLANRRTVAVIVRLVLDRDGQLDHGELVNRSGDVCARFAAWDRLVPAVRAWLAHEDEG